jgi:two-component system cell cycle sensor histidine kinase/response regulator CckA
MAELLRVLLIEDSELDAELILRCVRRCAQQIHFERVMTEKELRLALKRDAWDLVLSDFNLPSFSGLDALAILKSTDLEIPFILVSGTIGEDTAVDAVKKGASDYVLKSNLGRLPASIEYALREKKAAQEKRTLVVQLEQARKMEAIGRLAGGLAHDVNNVLAAVSLFAELAIDQIESDEPLLAVESLKGILGAQQSAAGIIRQLLAFSQRKSGPVKALNFCAVIQNLEPLLRRLIGENIDLGIQYLAEDVAVVADPAQIEQIVMNLAVNARDAMLQGGKLQFLIETKNLEKLPVDARIPSPPGRFVVLTAKDTGSGMSAETLEKIFEPFFTTKEVGKGTGLGLSVIYGILQQAGGTLVVESSLSGGTSFQIFWPMLPESSPTRLTVSAPAEGAKTSTGDKPAQILLVEDEENLRRPLVMTLQKNNYLVLEATQGEEALKIITEQSVHIDLLVTDVIMPRMGGHELAAKARKLFPKLPILFLSGYAERAPQDYDPDLASTWFLEKPFSRAVLLKKIREVLGGDAPGKDGPR